MIRQPVVAGQFYPSSAFELRRVIKSMLNEKAKKEDVIGLLSPHAGYPYSGPVAGPTISIVKFKKTFIIMSPSHTGRGESFSIMTEGAWRTPLGDVQVDSELAGKILAGSNYLAEDVEAHLFDHAIEVQLPFLQYFRKDVKIVPIVLAPAGIETYREIGNAIVKAMTGLKKDAVIMASGDMTHYESHESATRKDSYAIEAMLELDEGELLRRVSERDITMCGYAPAAVLISAAKQLCAGSAELIKYQTSAETTGDFSAVVGYAGIIIKASSPPVNLARKAVEVFIRDGKVIKPPAGLTGEMKEKARVFVSLKKAGQLRGCIGTFEPNTDSVAEEIIANAISSSTRDPRFQPVSTNELKDLDYSVDVLTSPEPVKSKEELNPGKYGMIVEAGWKRGLLLPDLEGVNTVDEQINICMMKARIEPGEPVKLYRFEVKRFR
jgi:MEMO1 family protein